MSGEKTSLEVIENQIIRIVRDETSTVEEKINRLTALHKESESIIIDIVTIDNAIEEIFGEELRRLNGIRERNLDLVNLDDIEESKDGYAALLRLIEKTLRWNPERQSSLEGVINRGSLRAMLIDPAVSVKTKQDVMDNWEDYM